VHLLTFKRTSHSPKSFLLGLEASKDVFNGGTKGIVVEDGSSWPFVIDFHQGL
jgi:hypothetical protein